MAVKIRLMRKGKKRSATYRVVVIDGRSPRDGRYIDQIGRYDPNQEPSLVELDNEKAVEWLRRGAQPTEPVRKLLEISGALARHKVVSGRIHTVAEPAGPAEPEPEAAEPEATQAEPAEAGTDEPSEE